jgi:hypothetical protein
MAFPSASRTSVGTGTRFVREANRGVSWGDMNAPIATNSNSMDGLRNTIVRCWLPSLG